MILNFITLTADKKFFNTIVYLMIFTFTITACGCYSTQKEKIFSEELEYESDYHIVGVTMKNGLRINLNDKGAVFLTNYKDKENVIVYRTIETTENKSGEKESTSKTNVIDINEVLYLTVDKEVLGAGGIIVIAVAVLAGIFLIAALIVGASSCPFIYSFNGEKYIFDAEPYGGSVAEGLKKTDYSRLEDLKAADGKYKLLMMNVTDETQYTDELKLLVIEHPLNTEIAPDISGKFTVFEKALPPVSVTDENGKDVTVFFNNRDNVQWQTDMPKDTLYENKKLKHDLIIKFPKPKDANKVKLLVNAGTAQWGEFMIKRMLEYRGNKVDNWYEDVNRKGNELMKLYHFVEREELFIMNADVLEGNKWVTRGTVSAGGPYIDEDRIVELNIENVREDTLYIKLSPPYGYWKIDYTSVIYESSVNAKITELPLSYAKNEKGLDLRDFMFTIDGKYYSMPDTTCSAYLEFDVPAQSDNMSRSLYLKTTGYYDIHLKKDKPEQTELIEKIYDTPGLILKLSINEYIKMIKSPGVADK